MHLRRWNLKKGVCRCVKWLYKCLQLCCVCAHMQVLCFDSCSRNGNKLNAGIHHCHSISVPASQINLSDFPTGSAFRNMILRDDLFSLNEPYRVSVVSVSCNVIQTCLAFSVTRAADRN